MKIEEVILSSKEIEDKHQRAYMNIIFSGIWLEQESLQPLKEYGLTHPQYNVMRIVNGYKKPIPVASIQQRMLFKTSNVTRIIDRLVQKKLVEKAVSPEDRRVVLIEITERGMMVLEVLYEQIYDRVRAIVGKNLSLEETITIGLLLDKMRD